MKKLLHARCRYASHDAIRKIKIIIYIFAFEKYFLLMRKAMRWSYDWKNKYGRCSRNVQKKTFRQTKAEKRTLNFNNS